MSNNRNPKKSQPKNSDDAPLNLPATATRRISFTSDDRAAFDVDARTARMSISSEEPVIREGGYYEILDHSPSSVRLGRLRAGANVIVDHAKDDYRAVVGVIEEAELRTDKRVEVLARYSQNSEAGRVVYADVVDRIRRGVSVGYNIYAGKREGMAEDGKPMVRITDWEPYEVTHLTVPADITVGPARSAENPGVIEMADDIDIDEDLDRKDDDVKQPVKSARAADDGGLDITDDIREIENDATKRERQRVNEINETARQWRGSKKVQVAARNAIERGTSWHDFNKRCLELLATDKDHVITDLGMSDREVKEYSILRMLNAQYEMRQHQTPLEKNAPFEYRVHLDLMEQLPAKRQDNIRGMLVPWDVQTRSSWTLPQRQGLRAPPADTVENVSLVATDHLADSFIEALRARTVVMAAGATTLNGLVGDVSIPREEAIPFEWLAQGANATVVDYSTDAVTMSPTTTAGHSSITRRLMKQSSPDADLIIRNNLTRGAGVEIDKQSLQGTGASDLPLGIRNQSGVGTVTISTGALTWPQAVTFEETVELAGNMLIDGGSYVMHPTMKRIAKTTSKDPGSGQFIWADGMVNGYPAFSTAHAGATADGIIFGNFSNLLIGFWGVLDLMTDIYTNAASGGVVIRAFQDVDVAVRRGQAFTIESLV